MCRTGPASSRVFIAAIRGASGSSRATIQPALLWRGMSSPSRVKLRSWRYSGRASAYLATTISASSELWAMALGRICGARGAMITPCSAPAASGWRGMMANCSASS